MSSVDLELRKSCVWVKNLICFGLLTLAVFESDIYIQQTLNYAKKVPNKDINQLLKTISLHAKRVENKV